MNGKIISTNEEFDAALKKAAKLIAGWHGWKRTTPTTSVQKQFYENEDDYAK